MGTLKFSYIVFFFFFLGGGCHLYSFLGFFLKSLYRIWNNFGGLAKFQIFFLEYA